MGAGKWCITFCEKTHRNIYLLLLKTSVWKNVRHFSVQCILTETTWLPTLIHLWQLRQRVYSLAQWLEHWSFTGATRDRFPAKAWDFFRLCFILLRLSCCKKRILFVSFLIRNTPFYFWKIEHYNVQSCQKVCNALHFLLDNIYQDWL